VVALVLAMVSVPPAWSDPGSPPSADAEQVRLLEELTALARKNAWSGVARVYGQLEARATPAEPLPMEVVVLGAQAALTAGEVLTAVHRLQEATGGEPRGAESWQAAKDLLADLEARYGAVRVTVYTARVPKLERPEMPLAPDERAVIDQVRRQISRDRRFLGMLPAGHYLLGDVPFDVEAGAPIAEVRVGIPPQSGSSSNAD
jgi:hypothetical protein